MVLATALLAAAVSAHDARRWSDWVSKDGDTLTGSFVPWADSRQQEFNRLLYGYASLHYPFSPFVGELVLSPGPGTDGDGTALKEPLLLIVETVVLPQGRAGAPSVANDAHYASNPFLAFGTPPGESGEAVFTFSSFFPAGTPLPLRAPVFAASVPLSTRRIGGGYGDLLMRLRWKVLDQGGATVASGIIPDAFSARSGFAWKSVELFAWKGEKDSSSRGSDTALATDASFRAWPMLARGVKSLSLDAGIIDRVFGDDSKAFAAFLRRARLVGVKVAFDEAASQSPVVKSAVAEVSREPVIIRLDSESSRWTYVLSGEAPCTQPGSYQDAAFAAHQTQDEEMIAPARMPGDTLGRDTTAYAAATCLFMLLFAIGTAALLIRFFAKRRGEARLAVWTALPAWCVAASAVVFLVVRPLLDRAPRADVTEWRFAIAGEPEELRVECGRAHSFSRSPAVWTMAADGWFAEGSICKGASITRGIPAGRMTLSGGPLVRGELEEVVAMRFTPRAGWPVSITADPDAHPATPHEFSALLRGWLRWSLDVKTPLREVTADADFSGVWVFTRGLWYGLGPMKKGETRKLDASMRIWQGINLSRKAYTTLFMKSPFSVRAGRDDITKKAEAWLAAAKGSCATPPIDADLAGDVCSAVVFALREGEDAKPDLAPSFKGSRRPVVTSRVVHVEVFK